VKAVLENRNHKNKSTEISEGVIENTAKIFQRWTSESSLFLNREGRTNRLCKC